MPGMVDTHIHAPQYVNAGMALDLPLLGWLNKYTFPTESRFADVDFARTVYSRVVVSCPSPIFSQFATNLKKVLLISRPERW